MKIVLDLASGIRKIEMKTFQTSVREHISEMVLNAYNEHLSETETDEE